MATEADESSASRKEAGLRKNDDISESSSPSDSDGDNSGDEAAAQKIEWLATTRAKRSTAGNRMKAMLANVEPAAEDSDLELLFAEDEDDAGFTDVENDASDVQMDSSSDDEDQEEGGDDLEGEKELERQAREKRNAQRKRKANEAIPAKFRKKVRIEQPVADSASVSSAAPQQQQHKPRPKKKSERLSWLPTAADMPTRASERRTTKMSKEQLHQKMVKDEIRRKKQLEAMEKKAARLEAMKKPPMTQAERLAEAALVEKRNSKSLNRWEVAEKQREEERLKKIAALNSRKLDGPVVTFWSGIQELEEGQLKHVGKMVSIEEKAPRRKRQSAAATLAAKELENAKAAEASKPPSPTTSENPGVNPPTDTTTGGPDVKPPAPETPTVGQTVPPQPAEKPQEPSQPPPTTTLEGQPSQPPAPREAPVETAAEKPSGPMQNQGAMALPSAPLPPSEPKQPSPPVLAAPVLAPPILGVQSPMPVMGLSAPHTNPDILAPPQTGQTSSQISPAQTEPSTNTPLPSQPSQVVPVTSTPAPRPIPPAITTNPHVQPEQDKTTPKGPDTPQQATPTDPPREGKVTKSCIVLQNFDEDAIKDKQVQTQILFGRKMNRIAKPAHAALCVITNHPARYRDPKTGLPFYNTHAYKEIQRALRGDYKFSGLLGAYVGSTKYAARGVPERFLDPTKPRSTPVTKPGEQGEGEKGDVVKQEDLTAEP
ncbi:YL1 nuclear domain containing protein, partial [Naviculisporaceae sp. PSN 640]